MRDDRSAGAGSTVKKEEKKKKQTKKTGHQIYERI